jgi:hypothetical protein
MAELSLAARAFGLRLCTEQMLFNWLSVPLLQFRESEQSIQKPWLVAARARFDLNVHAYITRNSSSCNIMKTTLLRKMQQ